ncbi:nickel insertion protein [Saccharopolyspora rosea]|uniref:Nickel insertion protein n=1 Tax=Saccharopolyspora rosea TaxID=524884 RepID=A0ABW3FS28_9PSEU|nr:nickel insertion protein [Saccharopolyspora rosea]
MCTDEADRGLRCHRVDRHALPRTTTTVTVDGHPVRVKTGPWRAKPEHDDVAAAARALGLPLRTVAERALAELRDSGAPDGGFGGRAQH